MQRVKTATNLKAYCDGNLKRAPRGNSPYVCPICGSGGSGNQNSDTAFSVMGERWHCHACTNGGDVFDLAGIINGTEDKAAQCEIVAEFAGVEGWSKASGNDPLEIGQTIRDDGPTDRGEAYGWNDTATATGTKAQAEEKAKAENTTDYAEGRARHREYIKQAQANIGAPDAVAYLASRGIDLETAKAWGLGYDPNAGRAQREDGTYCRRGRIVIPWPSVNGEEPYYHADRSIAPDVATRKYLKPRSAEVGPQPLWNPNAFKAPAFFVVEGQMDALAVAACGYEAVALGSTGDTDLPKEMKDAKSAGVAILMLDNDEVGRREQGKLAEALGAAGIVCAEAPTETMEAKDAGEAFATKPESFKAWVGGLYAEAVETAKENQEAAYREQMKRYNVMDTTEALQSLYELKEGRAPIPTGLDMFDRVTGGGLHAKSLHIIGAQSSEGKTTVTLQVADHVAASGHPVLFVSIEQRTSELMAKSLSRIAYQRSVGFTVLTARAITNPKEREAWTAEEWKTLSDACNEYGETVAPFIQFMDPDAPPTVRTIWEYAEIMTERYGEPPCVFVDYLQLLAADKGHERDSDKQVTDLNVTLLRRMAGALNTPVWVVAALNRQSYTAPISKDSFRESSSIEYGGDILMGLEPFDLETRWYNATEKKRPIVAKGLHEKTTHAVKRWMDLRILKNRFGTLTSDGIPFVYRADVDTFETIWKVRREKRADEDEIMGEPMEWDDSGDYTEM